MLETLDVLVIDDDKISQKVICRALQDHYAPRVASSGEEGLSEAFAFIPDIILLDVEMPGLNGYEVCDRLRGNESTREVPVIFLSSHGALRERMQGYEVGADDYLVKPFEPEALLARIGVLVRYHEQRREMQAQYDLAQKTATTAMTGSSELGQAMHFVEKSYGFTTFDELAQGLFTVTDWLRLNCCLLVESGGGQHWFASSGSIKPLEMELINMVDKGQRFFDFGYRTIVCYPAAVLLVKNMPLEDMERYGRVKDLLPVLLSAVNAKIYAMDAEQALRRQSSELTRSFDEIKAGLLELARSLADNQQNGTRVMREMLDELNYHLPRMGLDEDQETYILDRIDSAIGDSTKIIDAGDDIRSTFSVVVSNLQQAVNRQQEILDAFIANQAGQGGGERESFSGDVELF